MSGDKETKSAIKRKNEYLIPWNLSTMNHRSIPSLSRSQRPGLFAIGASNRKGSLFHGIYGVKDKLRDVGSFPVDSLDTRRSDADSASKIEMEAHGRIEVDREKRAGDDEQKDRSSIPGPRRGVLFPDQ